MKLIHISHFKNYIDLNKNTSIIFLEKYLSNIFHIYYFVLKLRGVASGLMSASSNVGSALLASQTPGIMKYLSHYKNHISITGKLKRL